MSRWVITVALCTRNRLSLRTAYSKGVSREEFPGKMEANECIMFELCRVGVANIIWENPERVCTSELFICVDLKLTEAADSDELVASASTSAPK